MIGRRPGSESIDFYLHQDDRDLVLNHLPGLPDALRTRFRFGIPHGKRLKFTVPIEDFVSFLEYVLTASDFLPDRKKRRQFKSLLEKLAPDLDELHSEIGGKSQVQPGAVPDEITEEALVILHEALETGSFKSLDDANKVLGVMRASMGDPTPHLNGLTREQARAIVETPWNEPGSVLKLSADFSADELKNVRLVYNARQILLALAEAGGTKATTAGNLNRKFCTELIGRFLPTPNFEQSLEYWKAPNEPDLIPIHMPRVLLTEGEFITETKGKFHLTPKGECYLDESEMGGLLAHMIHLFFYELRFDYFDRFFQIDGLCESVAYSIYSLQKCAGKWQPVEALPELILLPAVRSIALNHFRPDTLSSAVERRILVPLIEFGLLEGRYVKVDFDFEDLQAVRKSPLFDRMFHFEFA